jgi:hypothetical protein
MSTPLALSTLLAFGKRKEMGEFSRIEGEKVAKAEEDSENLHMIGLKWLNSLYDQRALD